jgi:hypothetical protein
MRISLSEEACAVDTIARPHTTAPAITANTWRDDTMGFPSERRVEFTLDEERAAPKEQKHEVGRGSVKGSSIFSLGAQT